MKRREFIELGIALAVVGGGAVAARFGWFWGGWYPGLKRYRQYNGCVMSRYVWKDASGRVVEEGPWEGDKAVSCGMAHPSEESAQFIHELTRLRRAT